MYELEIEQWGNRAAVKLDKELIEQISCGIGSKLQATIQGGYLILKPAVGHEYTIENLLKGYTKDSSKLDDKDIAWLRAKPTGKEL